MPDRIRPLTVLLLVVTFLTACSVQTQKRSLQEPQQVASLDRRSPFLKAHMRDGGVYVFSSWQVNAAQDTVFGRGRLLDVNREVVSEGSFAVPLDSVALFETNVVQTSPAVAALSVLTGASVVATAYCLTHPKACYGSCPTFYVWDGTRQLLQAEGFSASVAPALEARDVDALYRARPTGRLLEVRMKNEALETHVVRYVRVLAVRRPDGGRVFASTEGGFYQSQELIAASTALGPEGDFSAAVRTFDGVERVSLADSNDLASKESLDLVFVVKDAGRYGVVVAARQSLLSTYLFYQALAYMGRSATHWLASLGRGDVEAQRRSRAIGRILGGMEVLIPTAHGSWVSAGEINETGPLAADVRVVPLPETVSGRVTVRLRLTRGYWRIDWVALARLGDQVQPLRLEPDVVRRAGRADAMARKSLIDTTRVLTTLPGDEVTLVYRLPEQPERYELFLETRGYYLEWMREEWLAEEDPIRAAMMFLEPRQALRSLAPQFKKVEAELEKAFWNSRYAGH